MATTLRGSAHPFPSGSTGTSISIPSNSIASLAANDVVVIGLYVDTNNITVTPPSGWTLIDNQNQSAGPYNQVEYYHVVTGSEPANWIWTLGSSVFWDAELIAFTGCNTTTPLDAHTITTGNVGSSLTYNGADAVILFTINYSGANVSATGFTMAQNGDGLGLGYIIETTSGSTGSVTVSGGGGSASTVGLIALSPSGGSAHSLGTVARGTFVVRAGLSSTARSKFFTRTSLQNTVRTTFLTRIPLSGQMRETFQVAARLATTARSTFQARIGLQTVARTRFFARTALAQVAQATFKIASNLRSLGAVARTRFVTRAGLTVPVRSTFATRVPLSGQTRSTFATRIPLTVAARTRFYTRIGLQTIARSRFLIALFLSGYARSTFKIQSLIVPGALKGVFTSISRLTSRFSITARYSAHFAVVQRLITGSTNAARYSVSFLSGSRLKASFVRSVTMAQPYSTVDVTATILKSDNSVPVVSTLTVSVLFPDGTTTSYAYPTDITSLGSGQYKLTYITKGPGPHRETWVFTATDNSVGEFENTTSVSF